MSRATSRRFRNWLPPAILAAALVGGCSSGGGPTGGGGSQAPGQSAVETSAGGGGGGIPEGHRASGAKVRVVNTYVVPGGTPGPIDVYAAPYANSGDKPLISVPYGTVSDFFDPTVADSQGDMFLSFYASGATGNGNALNSQTATLNGGEVITYSLTTGDQQDDGSYGGNLQTWFDHPSPDGSQATPPPNQALLTLVSTGLNQTLSNPDASAWYLSLGHGCEGGLGSDPGITVQVNPGQDGAPFGVDPGQRTVSIHTAPTDTAPDCTSAPVFQVTFDAKAGESAVLFLYAPKDGDIHGLLVPLQP